MFGTVWAWCINHVALHDQAHTSEVSIDKIAAYMTCKQKVSRLAAGTASCT
jgi:hypothetical protein